MNEEFASNNEPANEFVTYRRYNNLFDTAPLVELLQQENIEYEIENASPNLDITFSANTSQDEFRVKIAREDFEKVDKLIQALTTQLLDQLDSDHYLFEFTEEELIEILEKPDEWSNDDYVIARKILSDRGKFYSDDQLVEMRNNRISFLKKPKTEPSGLVLSGWIFALLGGLFGLIIGWYLKDFKRTIFNGQRVYEFNEETRKKGHKMMRLGLIIHIICLVVYLLYLILSNI